MTQPIAIWTLFLLQSDDIRRTPADFDGQEIAVLPVLLVILCILLGCSAVSSFPCFVCFLELLLGVVGSRMLTTHVVCPSNKEETLSKSSRALAIGITVMVVFRVVKLW